MKTTSLLLIIMANFLLQGCINKHGISAKYYSDCDEYYDLQGYYHKDCGKDDIFTYKEAGEAAKKGLKALSNTKEEPEKNVW